MDKRIYGLLKMMGQHKLPSQDFRQVRLIMEEYADLKDLDIDYSCPDVTFIEKMNLHIQKDFKAFRDFVVGHAPHMTPNDYQAFYQIFDTDQDIVKKWAGKYQLKIYNQFPSFGDHYVDITELREKNVGHFFALPYFVSMKQHAEFTNFRKVDILWER